jgi:hypothetical protein
MYLLTRVASDPTTCCIFELVIQGEERRVKSESRTFLTVNHNINHNIFELYKILLTISNASKDIAWC